MSTLRVTNLQSAAGTQNVTQDNIYRGVARAWINFNGTGTVAIRDSYNVSSITDNGTGDYTVNFQTALANANYSMTGAAQDTGVYFNTTVTIRNGTSPSTTSARIITFAWSSGTAGVNNDSAIVCCSFDGGY